MIGSSLLDLDCNNQLIFVTSKENSRFAISLNDIKTLNSYSFNLKNSNFSVFFSDSLKQKEKTISLTTAKSNFEISINENKEAKSKFSIFPSKHLNLEFLTNENGKSTLMLSSYLYLMNHDITLIKSIGNSQTFSFSLSNCLKNKSFMLSKGFDSLSFGFTRNSFNSMLNFGKGFSFKSLLLSYKPFDKSKIKSSLFYDGRTVNIRAAFPTKKLMFAQEIVVTDKILVSASLGIKRKTEKLTTKILLRLDDSILASMKYKLSESSSILIGMKYIDSHINYCAFLSC